MNADIIFELGRLRRPPNTAAREIETLDVRMSIVRSLIKMRKAGLFRMIYCDNDKLAVVIESPDDISGSMRQCISWIEALKMVEEFERQAEESRVERKPPMQAGLADKAKCQKFK